jgi:hypothetical protein
MTDNVSTRSERLAAAADLRHVATMIDIEQIPVLSPLAVEQVRVAIGLLRQQAANLMVSEMGPAQ